MKLFWTFSFPFSSFFSFSSHLLMTSRWMCCQMSHLLQPFSSSSLFSLKLIENVFLDYFTALLITLIINNFNNETQAIHFHTHSIPLHSLNYIYTACVMSRNYNLMTCDMHVKKIDIFCYIFKVVAKLLTNFHLT